MLPKMNDKFAAYIEPARRNLGGLRFTVALIMLVLFYAVLTIQIILVFGGAAAIQGDIGFGTAFNQLFMDFANPNTPYKMIVVLCTFFAMFGAVWLTIGIFRRQGLSVLIGPGTPVRNFGIAALVMLPMTIVGVGFSLWTGDAVPNLDFGTWIVWMILALPLLLIQVSSEELIFRGYLMQELAVRFRSRWIWLLIPSLIFGSLHYDPARFGSNALTIIGVTTFFGIIAADVTVRTGNLGAAIGLHFMNNFQAMMLLSLSGTLNGLSLFVTKTHVSDEAAVNTMLWSSVGYILVMYAIYLFIMWRRERQLLQSDDTSFT